MGRKAKSDAVGPAALGLADVPGYRRAEWVDPRTLRPNPANSRVHPPDQGLALAESLDAVGWVKPLVCNEATGLLVDGHLRLELAIERGLETVPVVFGEWTPDQEGLILATLDAIGAQARIDRTRFAALQERLDRSGLATGLDGINRLRESIRTDPFFARGAGNPAVLTGQAPPPAAPPPLEMDGEDGEDDDLADSGDAAAPAAPPESHVRMVQLFLTAQTLPGFQARVAALSGRYGTPTVTDTVFEALRREAEAGPDEDDPAE